MDLKRYHGIFGLVSHEWTHVFRQARNMSPLRLQTGRRSNIRNNKLCIPDASILSLQEPYFAQGAFVTAIWFPAVPGGPDGLTGPGGSIVGPVSTVP